MEAGRLSGKLHSDENWIGMPDTGARELLITAWSWAIDHDKDDGFIPHSVMWALSSSLGHSDHDRDEGPAEAIKSLEAWGWVDPVREDEPYSDLKLARWEEQGELIRKARERREKERARYHRRKAAKEGG